MILYKSALNVRRYAMKREVAVFNGEFPQSMSDFKPGDTILGTCDRNACAFAQVL